MMTHRRSRTAGRTACGLLLDLDHSVRDLDHTATCTERVCGGMPARRRGTCVICKGEIREGLPIIPTLFGPYAEAWVHYKCGLYQDRLADRTQEQVKPAPWPKVEPAPTREPWPPNDEVRLAYYGTTRRPRRKFG